MAKIGGELNEARLRMARIPHGAALVKNKVSGAPGFWIGNVIVMAGVPVDHAGDGRRGGAETQNRRQAVVGNHPRRRQGRRCRHRTGRHRQGAIRTTIIGSYPFFDEKLGPNTNIVVRSRDPQKLADRQGRGRSACWRRVKSQLARSGALAKPKPQAEPAAARKKSFPSPGINSTATRARWPGGCTRRGRSTPWSPSPAAGWCRRRSWRAN